MKLRKASGGARQRRLGRGLGSLVTTPVPVDTPDSEPAETEASEGTETVQMISVDQIQPNSGQPRQSFDEEALDSLAASIRSAGVMQPVVVRPDGDTYQLVVGERRWRAAMRAGLPRIPA